MFFRTLLQSPLARWAGLAVLTALACDQKDSGEGPEDAGRPDEGGPTPPRDAGRRDVFVPPDVMPPDMPPPPPRHAGVIFTDFASPGTLKFISLDDSFVLGDTNYMVNSDAVLRWTMGGFRVVNRFFGDSFQTVDPITGTISDPIPTGGAGTNPQSIVVADDGTTFVSLYEVSPDGYHLIWFDAGETAVSGGLSLDDHAEYMPRAAALALAGQLAVFLQDLDGFNVRTTGKMVVLNPTTKEVVSSEPLEGSNPGTTVAYDATGSILYLPHQGDYAAGGAGGGIEVINTSPSLTPAGLYLPFAVGAIAFCEGFLFAVNLGTFPSAVHRINPEGIADEGPIFTAPGFLSELACLEGRGLAIPNGNRVRVVDPTGELVAESDEGPTGAFSIASN